MPSTFSGHPTGYNDERPRKLEMSGDHFNSFAVGQDTKTPMNALERNRASKSH